MQPEIRLIEDEDWWKCENCGLLWVFTNDGPEENDYRFCCHCGRKIAEYVYLEEISFAEED